MCFVYEVYEKAYTCTAREEQSQIKSEFEPKVHVRLMHPKQH